MLWLTEDNVRSLLPMHQAIRLVGEAFERLKRGESQNQPRRRLTLDTGSVLHAMAAADGRYFGTKVYATHPGRPAHFLVMLYDAGTARLLAMMEANALGQIRTGAASGHATRLLARPESATVALIGSGFQAATQLEAMRAVRPVQTVRVWSRSEEHRKRFAEQHGAVAAKSAEEAVRGADLLITATNAREPAFQSDWVSPGTHINAVGSNHAQRRELPPDLVRAADLIAVDSLEQSRIESGDLLMAGECWERVVELKDVEKRPTPEAVTIFKSNGLAIEDVVAAGYVYERALEMGRGRELRATAYS